MRRFRIHELCFCAGLTGLAVCALAQSPLPPNATVGAVTPAGPKTSADRPLAPIEYFRELLALSPAERERALANHTPEKRATLLTKLQEYDILPPEFREVRLHYTQVRWHLLDLMKMEPLKRSKRLTEVPAADRPLIAERLRLWDQWPAEVQKRFLENEGAMALMLQGQPGFSDVSSPTMLASGGGDELERWQLLPEEQRKELCDRFREFFDLDQVKKKKTLEVLPQAQRLQMEKTLQALEGLPPEVRKQRLESLRKFASMPPEVQTRFLKNATRWSAMSAHERTLWRDMANKLPPMPPIPEDVATNLPPMPPGWAPMPPPPMPQDAKP